MCHPVVVAAAAGAGSVVFLNFAVVSNYIAGHVIASVYIAVNQQFLGLFRLQVGQFARYSQSQTAHQTYTFGQLQQSAYFFGVGRTDIADRAGAYATALCCHQSAHQSQRGVNHTYGVSVGCSGKNRGFHAFDLPGCFHLVVIGHKYQKVAACLYLFLVCDFVELLLYVLVADVDYRELLPVVACGSVAYGRVYKVHIALRYGVVLVAAYASAL